MTDIKEQFRLEFQNIPRQNFINYLKNGQKSIKKKNTILTCVCVYIYIKTHKSSEIYSILVLQNSLHNLIYK